MTLSIIAIYNNHEWPFEFKGLVDSRGDETSNKIKKIVYLASEDEL